MSKDVSSGQNESEVIFPPVESEKSGWRLGKPIPEGIIIFIIIAILIFFANSSKYSEVFIGQEVEASKDKTASQEKVQNYQTQEHTPERSYCVGDCGNDEAQDNKLKPQSRCVGDCSNGRGRYSFEKGKEYLGRWKEGEMHGQGILTWPNGCKHEGIFEHNDIPRGVLTCPNGIYIGEFQDWMMNGSGKIIYADGSQYIGEWKDGKRHGYGTEQNKEGAITLVGYWFHDEYDGKR